MNDTPDVKVCPRGPTDDMTTAGFGVLAEYDCADETGAHCVTGIWQAMYDAAPPPPPWQTKVAMAIFGKGELPIPDSERTSPEAQTLQHALDQADFLGRMYTHVMQEKQELWVQAQADKADLIALQDVVGALSDLLDNDLASPQHAQVITFEGRPYVLVDPDAYEKWHKWSASAAAELSRPSAAIKEPT